MVKKNVLIFPAGSEIGLEILDSLKYSHHVEVFGASGKDDHASFVYDPQHYVEDALLYVDRPDFLERCNGHLRRLRIDYVYPTHDTVASFLAQHQDELAAHVVTSCARTNRIARSKRLTYATFRAFDFCPRVFDLAGEPDFPVFLKPDQGQGGKGTFRADDAAELAFLRRKFPDLLATEYLPGQELSVDCFTDARGQLLFVGPRTRERVQMGISFRSSALEPTEEIRRIAESINRTAALNGAWFFQVKQDAHGRFKLLEFAPRQSSTMGLYRHEGVNFALLSLFNAMGLPVEILRNDCAGLQLDRRLQNRFRSALRFERVYIDFDETIVAGQRVHGRVMDFLYQCRNRGTEIILITKHRLELLATLRELAISEHLFDRIIQLEPEERKADHIAADGAIFIDNYWFDRRDVRERLGIPVFDVDAVECLMQ